MLCSTIPPVFACSTYRMLDNNNKEKKSTPWKAKNSPNTTKKVGLGGREEESPSVRGWAGGYPGGARGCKPGRAGSWGERGGPGAKLPGWGGRGGRGGGGFGGREEGGAHARGRPGVLARRPASEVVEKQ